MKLFLRKCRVWAKYLGFNPFMFILFIKEYPLFRRDYKQLKKQLKGTKDFPFGLVYPIFTDRLESVGTTSGAYFHQDLLVARRIFENKPVRHIDIGSRVDGFVAHVAVFREIEVFDIRKQENKVKNVVFKQADLMNLPPDLINSCESISSLHAIEHFGLGRYGDAIDADGHLKAIQNIYEMLKIGGRFYFSVPIGSQRIEFNAHRVFSISYLLEVFRGKFEIEYFSYINDNEDLFEHIPLSKELIDNNCGCNFGCGIFELIKI